MPADITVKQGDTLPLLTDTLTYSDGSAVDLTGATVTFVMRAQTSATPVALTGTTSIVNPATAGNVRFTFTAADTSLPGNYMGNWLVTFPGGQEMTFPTVGYLWITIEESLTTVGGAQLVSLPDAKEYLNIPATDRTHDAELGRLIDAVRPVVENITGPVIPTTFEEWHDGGQVHIMLRRRPSTALGTTPILTLIGCSEFRGPIEYDLKIVPDPAHGTLYSCMLDPRGRVTRRTSGGGTTAFPAGASTVHAWYQAGQQTVPANVYEGTLELIRVNYQGTQQTGRARAAALSQDTAPSGPALGFFVPRRVRELLAPNRRRPSVA